MFQNIFMKPWNEQVNFLFALGFTGRRFIQNIGDSTENSMVCLDWFCEKEGQIPVVDDTMPCPCTQKQAELDYTFYLKDKCYETAFAENQMLQKCCYDT